MVDIVVDERAFEKSKLHAAIIEKVRQKMLKDPWHARPPSNGKKWREPVRLNGERFAANCRWEGGKIVIRLVGRLPTRKRRIRRKKK